LKDKSISNLEWENSLLVVGHCHLEFSSHRTLSDRKEEKSSKTELSEMKVEEGKRIDLKE